MFNLVQLLGHLNVEILVVEDTYDVGEDEKEGRLDSAHVRQDVEHVVANTLDYIQVETHFNPDLHLQVSLFLLISL